ncbi:MAG: TlyA family RNA methyltransferase [Coriobacteriales bacterium]|jgi:23S rRNA (cytidine1920-2'-O)/16S rRNA (cytidine1409-2'-O)-methyltransferase|nr:TlyA family RNA methyltransferase [Coriobacteriales bacterium]
MSSKGKIRLTELLVARNLAADVEEATRTVIAGDVLAPDAVLLQPNMLLDPSSDIRLRSAGAYVSRGGLKLAAALRDFSFDSTNLHCLDVGASTGGFTDCLLQHGARSVVAVDVAYGQFAWSLRTDSRVTVIERANIRELLPAEVGAPFDFIVVDVSFTPLRTLLGHLASFLTEDGSLVCLVKPQFELAGSGEGDKGVITASSSHIHALNLVIEAALGENLAPQSATFSPLKGPKGNIEFFLLVRRGAIPATIDTAGVVGRAHARLD